MAPVLGAIGATGDCRGVEFEDLQAPNQRVTKPNAANLTFTGTSFRSGRTAAVRVRFCQRRAKAIPLKGRIEMRPGSRIWPF
jgi:hypothetical protein